jgi:hypothetical protein
MRFIKWGGIVGICKFLATLRTSLFNLLLLLKPLSEKNGSPQGVLTFLFHFLYLYTPRLVQRLSKRSAWGRGYATEVCKRLLQFAFQGVSMDEVVASVDEDNVASQKVLKKSGLLDRGRTQCWGKDSPIYRITRDEWNDLQQSI